MYFEVANPKRVLIQSKEQYIDFVKRYNGVTNLYRTVYNFKYLKTKYSPDYNSAIVNQMFFDCDSERSLDVIKKFHNYLLERHIKHYMKQSSYMKFHIYVVCKKVDLTYKKNALLNAMIHLAKDCGLSYGDSRTSDLDKATFGDLARICPIAGTFKPNRKTYCSYISEADLYNDNLLKERADKGNGKLIYYGKIGFDLKKFDLIDKNNIQASGEIIEKDDFNVKFDNKFIDCLPPLIKKILTNHNKYCDNYKNRWICALYMRDIGYPESLTEEILRTYFSKQLNWTSMNGTGTQWDRFVKCKALWYCYHGEFIAFPNIDTLLSEGLEITKEDETLINKLYG